MNIFNRKSRSSGRPCPGKFTPNLLAALRAIVVLALLQHPLLAQLPGARLLSVFPPGAKAGSTAEVAVAGTDLDDATRLLFSDSQITSTAVENSNPPRFRVSIPSTVAPGLRDVRVIGHFGVSNPRRFHVGDRTELLATATNRSPENALAVSLGSWVSGRVDPAAADFLKFRAAHGQRVIIQCLAAALDSKLEPVLILSDITGREISHQRRGGLIDFTPSADGEFSLKLHDISFRGGTDYFYRLSFGTGPWIDYAFPPSGVTGGTNSVVIYGRNLPGGLPANGRAADGHPLEKLAVSLILTNGRSSLLTRAPSASIDGMDYYLDSPQGVSNPVFLLSAQGPLAPETGDNDTPAQAQKITPPCDVTGRFYPREDRDWFNFAVKKGEAYWLELFSQRLGLATDPFLLVQQIAKGSDGKEKSPDVQEVYDSDVNSGGVEFNTAHRDPSRRIEIKEDGECRVMVRDLFGVRDDPSRVYQLSIRQGSPDFHLLALPQAPPPVEKDKKDILIWNTQLRRGETLPIKVIAFRQNDFKDEINLKIEGLPAPLRASGGRIAPGATTATLFITAPNDAPAWAGIVRVSGTAGAGTRQMARMARAGSVTWPVADYTTEGAFSRLADDLCLSISGEETAPLQTRPRATNEFATALGGQLDIPLEITRQPDFAGKLKFRGGPPPFDTIREIEIEGSATNATVPLDITALKLEPGRYSFYLYGQTAGKFRKAKTEKGKESKGNPKDVTFTTFSGPIELTVKPAPVELLLTNAAVTIARDGAMDVPIQITRLFGFDGPVEITMASPPKDLSVQKLTINKGETSGRLALKAGSGLATGDLKARIQGKVNWRNKDLTAESELSITVSPK